MRNRPARDPPHRLLGHDRHQRADKHIKTGRQHILTNHKYDKCLQAEFFTRLATPTLQYHQPDHTAGRLDSKGLQPGRPAQ